MSKTELVQVELPSFDGYEYTGEYRKPIPGDYVLNDNGISEILSNEHWFGETHILRDKQKIKIDPYVGKIAVEKEGRQKGIIEMDEEGWYTIRNDEYRTIKLLKKDWYIQGEDC
jgi:hypothetical protein